MSSTASIEQRVDQIMGHVREGLGRNTDGETQANLSRAITLLTNSRGSLRKRVIDKLDIAINALSLEPPNNALASALIAETETQIANTRSIFSIFSRLLNSDAPPTIVIIGMGALLYFAIPIIWFYVPTLANKHHLLGIDTSLLILAWIGGAMGSIVSIMVRIEDFAQPRDPDPSVLFFTGFFKPVIGAVFAMFALSVVKSGIIPIAINATGETYFFLALSFVSGFSERFAQDIAITTERQFSPREKRRPSAELPALPAETGE